MSDLIIVGVYKSIGSAEQAISALQRARFPERQISAIIPDGREIAVSGLAGRGTYSGSGIGAAIAGPLGYLYGGAIARPHGLGPVLIVGPMAETLRFSMDGHKAEAESGHWLDPWAALGLMPNEIASYERALRDRLNLVVAQGSKNEIEVARRPLAGADAAHPVRHTLAVPASGMYAW
jgi:hypothetical protein